MRYIILIEASYYVKRIIDVMFNLKEIIKCGSNMYIEIEMNKKSFNCMGQVVFFNF